MNKQPCIVVLGATGLFGELLVKRLAQEAKYSIIGVSRGLPALERLKQSTNIEIAVLDRNDEASVIALLNEVKPFAVVDCAGPFQYYGNAPYGFAQHVLNAGSHYLDIADAPDFVSGITALDDLAKSRNVVAISGMSSMPAIAAAAADELCTGMSRVASIESALIPGNRARRTLSVMQAILGQIGQPFNIRRFGVDETVLGWGETRSINLRIPANKPVQGRLASLVHTPDVDLFPTRYNAETVTASAGLEIKIFHRALQLGRQLVHYRLLKSLLPFAAVARWLASWFEQLGSDKGGMQVVVTGDVDNTFVKRTWELVADDGLGPEIPTLPVSVVLDKLSALSVEAGARPSPGEISLNDLSPRFSNLGFETTQFEEQLKPLFAQVLGDAINELPKSVASLHNTFGRTYYAGLAESKGPNGLSGRLVAWVVGFPKAGSDVPVKVSITVDEHGETWVRDFNGTKFTSNLSIDKDGYAQERFGVLAARLGLAVHNEQLHYPVVSATLFGFIPLPRFLLPVSIAHETVDASGRFVFDVLIKTPFGARIAHYQGWLERQDEEHQSSNAPN